MELRLSCAGARLVDICVPPRALVEAGGKLRLHAVYYITKQIIPALERVLNLVGADPRAWFVGMTKPQRLLPQKRPPAALPLPELGRTNANAGTIDQYYLSRHCAVRILLLSCKILCNKDDAYSFIVRLLSTQRVLYTAWPVAIVIGKIKSRWPG